MKSAPKDNAILVSVRKVNAALRELLHETIAENVRLRRELDLAKRWIEQRGEVGGPNGREAI